MQKIEFTLKNEEEYITLPQLLKYLSLLNSGGEIKYYIENELIKYNGEIEFRKRKKCFAGDIIIFNNEIEIIIKK